VFSFLQISSSKHSTHLDHIATLIISSHQTLGPLSVLFPSDFFTKTLYKSRPNPHFNIILPTTPRPPKCSKTTTTIHTVNRQQLHTRQLKTSNKTHEKNYNFTTCRKAKNTQAREYFVQFLNHWNYICEIWYGGNYRNTWILVGFFDIMLVSQRL